MLLLVGSFRLGIRFLWHVFRLCGVRFRCFVALCFVSDAHVRKAMSSAGLIDAVLTRKASVDRESDRTGPVFDCCKRREAVVEKVGRMSDIFGGTYVSSNHGGVLG